MLTVKKIQALAETVLWLIAVVMIICVGLPVGAMLTFAGMICRRFHIEAVSKAAGYFMNAIIGFVKFVTLRIRKRTREIEALRTK